MFKSFLKIWLVALMCTGNALQAAIPNTDNPTSFVGPTGKAKYSTIITQNSAFSVLGEAGPRNYRLGGTLGWRIQENQRFKVSGDFLRQDIEYAFFSGNSREWVKQGSIGAHYQYDLYQYRYLPQFNLKGGYSHAPSKDLTTVAGSYVNALGLVQNYVNDRRIAGSDAGYISPGLSIEPWQAGRIGAELNYDDVQYDRIYLVNQHAVGFGGTANFIQKLGANTQLGMSAGFRAPFNAYQANIAYTLPSRPDWTLGVDANYVEGKHYLPNTYNVGLSVSYAAQEVPVVNYLEKEPSIRPLSGLANWVAEPAIYLPQVLAIPDERVFILITPPPPPACLLPTSIGIPTLNITGDDVYDISPFFNSTTPLTYSITVSPGALSTVTINATTGLITISNTPSGDETFTVTVTATNSCGSVSIPFTVNFTF